MASLKVTAPASDSQRPAGSCLCWRRHNKVIPDLQEHEDWKIIEIRPGRCLRVIHINQRPRDEKFAKEMHMFQFYQKQSLSSSSNNAVVSSGPLAMPPQRKQTKGHSQQPANPKKLSYVRKRSAHMSSHTPDGVSKDPDLPVGASPVQSTGIHSASSVIVGIPTLSDGMEAQKPPPSVLPEKESVPSHLTPADLDCSDVSRVEEEVMESRPQTPANCAPAADRSTVLFFIHGVGGSADVWTAQMKHFADKGYEVVALDLIGHGYSSAPRNSRAYHFDEIVMDTTELFDAVCKRRNVVIGHSYG